MTQYTTGEIAKACQVSVRTVQFYDSKDLLKPSDLSEGGRRLYSEDDLQTLRLICTLKALGLTLASIRGILHSEEKSKVLMLLLEEQERQISYEIESKQKQLQSIQFIQSSLRTAGGLPVNTISDMEHIMKNAKKLRNTHITMLVFGLLMDAIEVGTVLLWIFRGIWWPFAAGMVLVVLTAVWLVRLYYRNTEYICANCNTHFKPKMKEFFFAKHTWKTRKLTCTACGHNGYCVEIGSEDTQP